MKTLVTLFFTLLLSTTIQAQASTCDCKTDLDFLMVKMKEMPSYKHQVIKANKESEFQSTYDRYAKKMLEPVSITSCFIYLNEMMATLTDHHTSVTFNGEGLSKEQLSDPTEMKNFLSSTSFMQHPTTDKDLATLKTSLQNKQKTAAEGIYIGRELTVGVYRNTVTKKWEGVVLESNLETWLPGHIIFYLTETAPNRHDMFYYDQHSRKMLYSKGVSISNGRIKYYVKEGIESHELNFSKDKWVFKQLNDSVQYIYFGEFSNTKAVKQASKDFFEKMKDSLDAAHLIIDVRNNGGGNKKHSDLFLKLFRKNKGKNYVLTNSFTASNAEQFTVKLKSIPNTIHMGEATRGILAYGMNYGYRYETPSNLFMVRPTDMDFHNGYFQYEGKGVSPDMVLDYQSDWVAQTLEYISQHSNL